MRLFALLLVIALAPACAPAEPDTAGSEAPAPVLLTVFSASASGTAPRVGLFDRYGLEGAAESATAAELAALGGVEMRATFPAGETERVWSGPRLSAVLAAAGAPGAGARLTALDGYQVTLDAARIARHEPILALSVDGEALALGGLGPVMLVWPRTEGFELAEMNDDLWPWGVFAVETIEE